MSYALFGVMDVQGQPVTISKDNINLKTTGNVVVGTTENAGRRFYPREVYITTKTVSLLTVGATFSVGQNSPSYNDIMPLTLIAGIGSVEVSLPIPLTGVTASVPPGTDIVLRVTIGAIATTHTVRVDVIGDYI